MVQSTRSSSAILFIVLIIANAPEPCLANKEGLPLVPKPKQVQWSTTAPIELKEDNVAIVVGKQAKPPEQYAAEMLQAHVAKRFRQKWPILSENQEHKKYPILILLGQPTSHRMLDRLCSQKNIALNE